MNILEYTTYAEVRAALGVSEEEMEDTTLELPLYANTLEVDLEDINVNVPIAYATAKAAIEAGTATLDQQRFVKAANLFATYAVAKQCTVSLRLFSPEQITDGKAMIRRPQADAPYQKTIDSVLREYSRFRTRLSDLFQVVNSSSGAGAVTKTVFVVSSPSSDPILGT